MLNIQLNILLNNMQNIQLNNMLLIQLINMLNIQLNNMLIFFFSSRRRHTMCYRDWSSDVCSSDLEQTQYAASVHGKAAARRDPYAPGCTSCHGAHNVLRPSSPGSPTSTIEIPRLCGSCHSEGTPVSLTRQIPQSNILANYLDSIHGEGLFKRG